MGTRQTLPETRSDSQATYLPDRHVFALWTWAGGAVGAAPPVGDVETVPLAVPTPDLGRLKVSDVDCVLIEPDRLAAVPLDSPGRSVEAWRSWIAGGESALPIAAHAVPDPTGVAVTTAEHAGGVFRRTTAVGAEMRTGPSSPTTCIARSPRRAIRPPRPSTASRAPARPPPSGVSMS
ncbi:hypothetical protein ABZ438_31615 [Streptomyces sp. NPDC005786]|uniref:hypothetical protein n=1 Tax=Streptomyces sp. NPDC005786 TaxID=3154891 RepID=UPI003410EEC5